MSSIEEKFEIFEKNCIEKARLEAYELKVNMNKRIQERIEDEINEYKVEAERKYNAKINKMEKKYNSDIFEIENQSKREILEIKNKLIEEIKIEVQEKLKEFVQSSDYIIFLEKSIAGAMKNEPNSNYEIYITENDYYRFKDTISHKFNCTVKATENEMIGGCLAVDIVNNIMIDNSIKNRLEEQISN